MIFYFPSGKRDPGETDAQTLAREIWEELNVQIDVNSMEFVGIFRAQADGHPQPLEVKMTCYQANYRGELQASSEIEEFRWLSFADIDIVSAVDKKIFAFLREK